jgi:PhoPQ-activated pathogenicity-related protein
MIGKTCAGVLWVALLWSSAPIVHGADSPPAPLPPRTALDDYVEKPDAAFEWKPVRSADGEGFRAHLLRMTSQRWRSDDEMSRSLWEHWLYVVVPPRASAKTAMLFIGGGANDGKEPSRPDRRTTAIAIGSGAVVAELRMVPNQPLAFKDDGRPRTEDDLLAGTWLKFLDSGDPDWIARFAMVKSAVRAMDAVQAFLRSPEGGGIRVESFVVAGGSKRGWTTWLTGAVDKRVVGIAPIVIDVLNMVPSMDHHYAAYGFWAPAIGDYEQNGIMKKRYHPRYDALVRLEDPYFYRHRLTMPKFVLNSAGDQFFLPDSWRFYYDDLQGEKVLRYVPNSDHSLRDTDAGESLGAWFHLIATGKPRPKLSWTFDGEGGIRARAETAPKEARLWQAVNPAARDFRLETLGPVWTSQPLSAKDGGVYEAKVEKPAKGFAAYLIEFTFDVGAPVPLKLTTPVRVIPDVLPHAGKLEALKRELKDGKSASIEPRDWPQWRRDAARSAATELPLPEGLRLLWKRELPPLEPAYRHPRLGFDGGYEPVVAGGRLFVASSRSDSVAAYDAESGGEIWRFY